ncbi:DNA alkylation repair protein [Chitinophaga qingshengii]|uniref:DNA alkylation repair protein n=1 Tax=Chitinophaga qingshengii TaxID=1569794 RepID=A0ABR7TLQ5_9BACT|nr:DNA alkylation repair protein [Chitinophaga qingshengii]MBC9930550.1 DNA alkylation repair protein [Chitinophaga qingshengii]
MNKTPRKGAKSIKDITPAILQQLNSGAIATVNLTEWLAVDQRTLLTHLLQQLDRPQYLSPVLAAVDTLKKATVNTINEAIGTTLLTLATAHQDRAILQQLAQHPADMVRCWSTYTIGRNPALSLEEKLYAIQPFAADEHFGVREICWMAVRPDIATHIVESIHILSTWTTHASPNVRRFASEATRPRGVWCEHIEALKKNPEIGLTILEPLKTDEARYVQDSVGNWLNDASKTRPDFVQTVCDRWQRESNSKATTYIIKKAMRTIEK